MMKRTHIAIGIAATLPIILGYPVSAMGLIGSIAPDWDLYLGIKHRTYTHSLLMVVISSLTILYFNNLVAIVWFINYLLHLVADSFTQMGVPWFYPKDKKYYGKKLFKTRGTEDYFIQLLAIMLMVAIYIL